MSLNETTAVYLIGVVGGTWKIGIATHPFLRLEQLQIACPFELVMYGFVHLPTRKEAAALERDLHRRNAECRLKGEWFDVVPSVVFAAMLEAEKRARAVAA